MWDSIPPDARDPQCSSYLQRDLLIISYINWAFTKRWAWDGLNRLLVTLEDRREPIPEPLKEWSCSVVSRRARGTLKVPHKPNPKNKRFAPKDGRDLRIMRVFNVLCENGWSEEEAKDAIMVALADHLDGQTIRSVFRKMETFTPFKRQL